MNFSKDLYKKIENNDKVLFVLILASCLSFLQENIKKLQTFINSTMKDFLTEHNPKIVDQELNLLNNDFSDLNKIVKKEVFEFFEGQLFTIFETLSINYFSIEKFSQMQNSFKEIIIAYYGNENKNIIDKLNCDLQEGN